MAKLRPFGITVLEPKHARDRTLDITPSLYKWRARGEKASQAKPIRLAPSGRIGDEGVYRRWQLAGGDMRDRNPLKNQALRGAKGYPDLLQRRGRSNVVQVLRSAPSNVRQLPVQSANHVSDTDLFSRATEPKATVGPALTTQQPTTAQLTKDGLKVLAREALGDRQLIRRSRRVRRSQLADRAQGIVNPGR